MATEYVRDGSRTIFTIVTNGNQKTVYDEHGRPLGYVRNGTTYHRDGRCIQQSDHIGLSMLMRD
jgi:hypothetical protein